MKEHSDDPEDTSPPGEASGLPASVSPIDLTQTIGPGGKPSDFAAGGTPPMIEFLVIDTQKVSPGGLASGFEAGVPDLDKQLQFSAQSVPDGPDELKQEVADLAHTAITAVTRESSVPQSAPEDWLETLKRRGYRFETMEELLVVSGKCLHSLALDALAVGPVEYAERLAAIEKRFKEVQARFFPPITQTAAADKTPPAGQPAPPETIENVDVLGAISDFDSLNRISSDDPAYPMWKDFYVEIHKSDGRFASQQARRVLEGQPLDIKDYFARAVELYELAAETQISLVTNLESVGDCERHLKATMAGTLKIFGEFLKEFGQDETASGAVLSALRLNLLELAANAKVDAIERVEMIEKQPRPAEQAQGGAIVDLLLRIVEKQGITIEGWAQSHGINRTTFFDWKALRVAGQPLKGRVSESKGTEIETAIEKDAVELGLTTRTDSD